MYFTVEVLSPVESDSFNKLIGIKSFARNGLPENGLDGRLEGSLTVDWLAAGVNCGTQGDTFCNSAILILVSVSSICFFRWLVYGSDISDKSIFRLPRDPDPSADS